MQRIPSELVLAVLPLVAPECEVHGGEQARSHYGNARHTIKPPHQVNPLMLPERHLARALDQQRAMLDS